MYQKAQECGVALDLSHLYTIGRVDTRDARRAERRTDHARSPVSARRALVEVRVVPRRLVC